MDGFQKKFLVIFAIWTSDRQKLCEKSALLLVLLKLNDNKIDKKSIFILLVIPKKKEVRFYKVNIGVAAIVSKFQPILCRWPFLGDHDGPFCADEPLRSAQIGGFYTVLGGFYADQQILCDQILPAFTERLHLFALQKPFHAKSFLVRLLVLVTRGIQQRILKMTLKKISREEKMSTFRDDGFRIAITFGKIN